MLEKLKSTLSRDVRTVADRLRRVPRGWWERLGRYGALALLLALMALASNAYRHREDTPKAAAEVPGAALPVIQLPQAHEEEAVEAARWVWPLEGEIVGAYSPDAPVWSQTLSQWQTHPALDIAGAPGEAVYACADGTVSDAWSDRLWGNTIVLEHPGGYVSTYRGLNTLKLVEPGDAVSAGDIISAVGASLPCEADQPAHLHFELSLDGQSVDFAALVAGEVMP